MDQPPAINRAWSDPVIVAASGPSLTAEVIHRVRMTRWLGHWRVVTVNDASKVMPWADAIYAADKGWWQFYNGMPDFEGQRYCCVQRAHDGDEDATEFAQQFPNVWLVAARPGTDFSRDPARIHFGDPENSGFQAVNLAILLGASRIVLVGFDGRVVAGKSHFFGEHPPGLNRQINAAHAYRHMAHSFDTVAPAVPIVNATPESAITRFPTMTLDEALTWDGRVHRHGPVADAIAN